MDIDLDILNENSCYLIIINAANRKKVWSMQLELGNDRQVITGDP